MNQDNNFNQNNFNFQGNNGMSNNQPLNNQSFNQNMNVNQSTFKQQPQLAPSFQQPIMHESIPQSMSTFESGSASNQSFNSKSSKKMNLGLIIGIIAAVTVVGVGIVFGSKLLSNGGNNGNNNNNNINAVNNIKNGTAKLVYTSKNPIHQINDINAYNYFYTYESYGPSIVLDNKGNELFRAVDPKYLGDTYFLIWGDENNNNRDYVKIYDANKKKIVYQFDVTGAYWAKYKNGILYYNGNTDMTTAYDLINQKQLWSVNVNGNIMEVTNEHVFFSSKNYSSIPDIGKGVYSSIVLDLNGNMIIEGNTDEYEYYTFEKENLVHTFVVNDNYYLKVKFKKYIEVYDFNHKLLSNISLEPSETTTYYLHKIFDEGLFTVYESNNSGLGKYVLYDVNKNIVLESDSNIDYASNIDGSITSSNVLVLESASKYYLIKDGKIVEKFDDYQNENLMLVSQLAGDENSYLLIENNDTVNSIYTKQYINLKTLEKFDVPLENVTERFEESPNGEYIRLSTGNDFYIYDSKFNLKYESINPLKPINDKYVFEYTLEGNKISVVNIENGKKNEIEIKGVFKFELSSGGFVTSDGTNYYLYGFN